LKLQKYLEYEVSFFDSQNIQSTTPVLLEFRGSKDWFKGLNAHQPQVKKEILKRLRMESKHGESNPKIGIHFRQGDFLQTNFEELYEGKRNVRAPIEWYLNILDAIVVRYPDTVFQLFSDLRVSKLKSIFSGYNVNFSRKNGAMRDLVNLSDCKIIIGSRSTFSLWAHFLGDNVLVLPDGKFLDFEDWLPFSGENIIYLRHNSSMPDRFRELLVEL